MINQIGRRITFEADLFEEPEEKPIEDLISENLISDEQLEEYRAFDKIERYRDGLSLLTKYVTTTWAKCVIDTRKSKQQVLKKYFPEVVLLTEITMKVVVKQSTLCCQWAKSQKEICQRQIITHTDGSTKIIISLVLPMKET